MYRIIMCLIGSIFKNMNFLAHAYLSFNVPEILIGNMISDFVKGRKKFDYPSMVQKGIQLHRQIDDFTDFHPVTAKAKELFRPHYRLYSGAFIDIVYDHFLANDDKLFEQSGGLKKYTENIYSLLNNRADSFPEPFKTMFPYMVRENWLHNYRHRSGMYSAFGGLVHRAKYLNEYKIAIDIFNENYEELQTHYNHFFPDLEEFSTHTLSNLMAG